MAILLATAGLQNASGVLTDKKKRNKLVFTQGISPYFLKCSADRGHSPGRITARLTQSAGRCDLLLWTGMRNPDNVKMLKKSLKEYFFQGIHRY